MQYPRYDPTLDTPPLADEEIEALDALLQALPADNPMNVEAMDGYLTALLVGPRLVDKLQSADWLPAVWGGDGEGLAPFDSQRQRKRMTQLVLRHLHAVDMQLRRAPQHWQPVFSVAEVDGVELVDAEDWCIGFLQAAALDSEAWGAVFDAPQTAAALAPLVLLGGDDSELTEADRERLADPDQRDSLSRAVMDAVLLLLPPVVPPVTAK